MRRRAVLSGASAVAATVLVLGGAAACSDAGEGTAQPGGSGYVEGSGTVTRIPPSDRKPAPALKGPTLDGRTVSLADYRGKVVVLNVWGSWCPPCRKEAPDLEAAAKALAGKGIGVLGINTRDNDKVPANSFVQRFGITYPSVYDPDGHLLLGFRDTVPPNTIPSTLVIDRQGRVAARILGGSTRTTFEQLATDVAAGR